MSAASERTRRYRAGLRKQGLRPIQIAPNPDMVPDTRSPEFAEQVRRECEMMNAADEKDAIYEWLDAVSILNEPDETG